MTWTYLAYAGLALWLIIGVLLYGFAVSYLSERDPISNASWREASATRLAAVIVAFLFMPYTIFLFCYDPPKGITYTWKL